jgi:hypothetical protein
MIPEAEGAEPMTEPNRHLIELPDNVSEMSDEELDALADRIYDHIMKAPSE